MNVKRYKQGIRKLGAGRKYLLRSSDRMKNIEANDETSASDQFSGNWLNFCPKQNSIDVTKFNRSFNYSRQTPYVEPEVETLNPGGHMNESSSQKLEELKHRIIDSGDYATGLNIRSNTASTLAKAEGFPHSSDIYNKILALCDANKDDKKVWNFGDGSKIWSGAVECPYSPSSTRADSKLREEVSQDGDDLLSDLSRIQEFYMEEGDLPSAEFQQDSNEILTPEDRQRRHSMVEAHLEDLCSVAHVWKRISSFEGQHYKRDILSPHEQGR